VVVKLFGLRPGDVRLRTFHAHKGTDDVRVVGRLTGQDSAKILRPLKHFLILRRRLSRVLWIEVSKATSSRTKRFDRSGPSFPRSLVQGTNEVDLAALCSKCAAE
jgi:hypothetical protein